MFRNSDLISHAIYSQQVKRRASVTAEGFLVELGREKEGLRGIPPHPTPFPLLWRLASALSKGDAPGILRASFCLRGAGRGSQLHSRSRLQVGAL